MTRIREEEEVVHCYYVCISYRFWDVPHQIMVWPWNLGYRLFKVIENGTIWKLQYDFLLHSIVTMALSRIISKIKWDACQKSQFFHTPLHLTPLLGGPHQNMAISFIWRYWNGVATRQWKSLRICLAVWTEYQHVKDRRMNRQTSCNSIVGAMHSSARK